MKTRSVHLLACMILLLALAHGSLAQGIEGGGKTTSLAMSGVHVSSTGQPRNLTGTPRYQVLNINNLWSWHRSDGAGNQSPSGRNGLVFPQFTAATVYADNLVIGGKVFVGGFPEAGGIVPASQPIRVNGGSYESFHGMDAGWVEGLGATAVPLDPNGAEVRVYRIRRDYAAMTDGELTEDAQIFFEHSSPGDVTQSEKQAVLDQYALDWAEWPVAHAWPYSASAPYIERNGLPGYQAPPPFTDTFTVDSLVAGGYDEPGVPGADPNRPADQVIYTVFNGLRGGRTVAFAGSQPLGLEVQKTVWAYKRGDAIGDAYFVRYRIVNRGGVDVGGGQLGSFYLDSVYVGQWSDMDIGSFGDDLAGCDSLRNLGYVYNSNDLDNDYAQFSLPPPACGYMILAGALVEAPADSGVFDFTWIYGKKNQTMSSFAFSASMSPYADPPPGNYETGAGQWWKLLRGYAPIGSFTTQDFTYYYPPGYPITRYPFSGDPVTGSGFLDGLGEMYSYVPGDRRIVANSGPFRLAPGEAAEMYVSVVAAMGSDRLSSVGLLKEHADLARAEFRALISAGNPTDVEVREAPRLGFELVGNYPNPFNPSTTITFTAAQRGRVSIVLSDVLGREVATLVDGELEAGEHKVIWDARRYAGGVYICRIQAGDFIASHKLLYLK